MSRTYVLAVHGQGFFARFRMHAIGGGASLQEQWSMKDFVDVVLYGTASSFLVSEAGSDRGRSCGALLQSRPGASPLPSSATEQHDVRSMAGAVATPRDDMGNREVCHGVPWLQGAPKRCQHEDAFTFNVMMGAPASSRTFPQH